MNEPLAPPDPAVQPQQPAADLAADPSVRRRRLQAGDLVPFVATGLGNGDGADASTTADRRLLRVHGALPGESGTAQLRDVGQHALWAVARSIDVESAERVVAPCSVVLECGGCPWQMASLTLQRQHKEQRIRQALGQWPNDLEATWWPGPAEVSGHRTRALMMAGRHEGLLAFGFFAPGSRRFVAAHPCDAQHPQLNTALAGVLGLLRRLGVRHRDDERHRGDLRAVQLRLDPAHPDGLLTLVVPTLDPWKPVAREFLGVPGISGVFAQVRADADGTVLDTTPPVHLAGRSRQRWQVADDILEVGPTAFVQTHHGQAQALLQTVADLLPDPLGHLVDVYAGIGVFGLSLRHRAAKVTLLERDGAATEDARFNIAKLAATDHVTSHTADAGSWAPQLAQSDATEVILDPPRAGCDPQLLRALPATTELVILISCGLPGLKRDAALLSELGWRVDRLVAHDLFPHTPHAEVVTRWRRD